ncbi:hypothetical protein [Nocardioides lentus]|uniref:hypothetical protein n=1 Tax=Nocardioides lentus TaxID=338077 RepID=UPI0031E40B7E
MTTTPIEAPSPGFEDLNDGPPSLDGVEPPPEVVESLVDTGIEVNVDAFADITDIPVVSVDWVANGRVWVRFAEAPPTEVATAVRERLQPTAATAADAFARAATAQTAAAAAKTTADSAEAGRLGQKMSTPQTGTSGPRAGLDQRGGRGWVDLHGEDGTRGGMAMLAEALRQVLTITSNTDDVAEASRLVLRSGDGAERSATIFTDLFEVFAPIMARQGLVLPRGPLRLNGLDFGRVDRTTADGQVAIAHTVGQNPIGYAWLIGGHFNYQAGVDSMGVNQLTVGIRNRTDRQLAAGATVSLGYVVLAGERDGGEDSSL